MGIDKTDMKTKKPIQKIPECNHKYIGSSDMPIKPCYYCGVDLTEPKEVSSLGHIDYGLSNLPKEVSPDSIGVSDTGCECICHSMGDVPYVSNQSCKHCAPTKTSIDKIHKDDMKKEEIAKLRGKFRSNPNCICAKCRAKRQFNEALKILSL